MNYINCFYYSWFIIVNYHLHIHRTFAVLQWEFIVHSKAVAHFGTSAEQVTNSDHVQKENAYYHPLLVKLLILYSVGSTQLVTLFLCSIHIGDALIMMPPQHNIYILAHWTVSGRKREIRSRLSYLFIFLFSLPSHPHLNFLKKGFFDDLLNN